MQFRIADTFTDSLARLMGDEQKQVKLTVMNLQLDPSHPSLQFHKLGKARDPRFWLIPRWTPQIRPLIDTAKPATRPARCDWVSVQ